MRAPAEAALAAVMHDGVGYRDLYYLWESQQWQAGKIELSRDHEQWAEMAPALRHALSWLLSRSLIGERSLSEATVSFADAVIGEEEQVFLTAQLADLARHRIFADRLREEVFEGRAGGDRSPLGEQAPQLAEDDEDRGRDELLGLLRDLSARVARRRDDLDAVVEGFVVYYMLIDGGLALTTQRFLMDVLERQDGLPALQEALVAVARDNSRHLAFGISYLRDMVEGHAGSLDIVTTTVESVAPLALLALETTDGALGPIAPEPHQLRDAAQGSLSYLQGLVIGEGRAVLGDERKG